MALNPSGVMSIGGTTVGASINLELGLSATANSSIGQTNFRELAKVPTGAISLSDFYGKSKAIKLSITENTIQYVLSPAVVPGYVAGSTSVELTIGANVYVYSDNVSAPGLLISGFVEGDRLSIINNGFILGKGGKGGSAAYMAVAQNGGSALSITCPTQTTIQNNLYIAGGGGGGSAGSACAGGGGAGGGAGGDVDVSAGGVGGGPGQIGGKPQYEIAEGGAGGGRILPGVGGAGGIYTENLYVSPQGGGAGGGAGSIYYDDPAYSQGGAGGSGNNPGQNSYDTNPYGNQNLGRAGSGGGGWGAVGGSTIGITGFPPQPVVFYGGLGGKAIALNGNGIFVTITGLLSQIYGDIS